MVEHYKSIDSHRFIINIRIVLILLCRYGKKDLKLTKRFSTHHFPIIIQYWKHLHGVTSCPSLPGTVLVSTLKVLYHRKCLSSKLLLNLPSAPLSNTNPFWHLKTYSQNVLKAPLIHSVNGFFQKCMISNIQST